MRQQVLLLGLIFVYLSTISCGDEGPSGEVDFSMIPERPLIITAGFTMPDSNPGDEVDDSEYIDPPWFSFKMRIKNGTDDYYMVVNALEITVSNDLQSEDQFGFASAELSSSQEAFLVLKPGEEDIIANSIGNDITFYIGGFTENSNENNFSYRVVVKPFGWFVKESALTSTDEEDRKAEALDIFSERLRGRYHFRTQ